MITLNGGDYVVFGRGKKNSCLVDITIGRIYEVFEGSFGMHIVDDVGDMNCTSLASDGKPTKIIN